MVDDGTTLHLQCSIVNAIGWQVGALIVSILGVIAGAPGDVECTLVVDASSLYCRVFMGRAGSWTHGQLVQCISTGYECV